MHLNDASYLRLAVPFMLAAVTTPLLGAVGTAVMGHLGNADYINGVALGAVIFNTIYWLFGFLRLITSSFCSQAVGRQDDTGRTLALLQPGIVALCLGLLLMLFQNALASAAVWVLNPAPHVRELMLLYFRILIWGAPFVLCNYVALGWLMGQMRMKAVVALQIATNLVNCLLNVLLVDGFGLHVDGIAIATLATQAAACAASILLAYRNMPKLDVTLPWRRVFEKRSFSGLMSANGYLMIRTVCMLVMVNTFMARSAEFPPSVMAANAILFQIQFVFGDMFEGFASASSVYAGMAVGEGNRTLFQQTLRCSARWCAALSLGISAFYWILDESILGFFTDLPDVRLLAQGKTVFLLLFSPIAAAGIVFYGVFNGALQTRYVCFSMLLTTALFLASYFAMKQYGNTGLWIAYLAFYAGRSGFLLLYLPVLCRKLFPQHSRVTGIRHA